MGDLTNPKWICVKGFLFLLTGLLASVLLVAEAPTLKVVALLAVAVWCFCRFYYFAFYVIQHYVDPNYRFSSLYAFALYLLRRRRSPPEQNPPKGGESGTSAAD